VQREWEHGLKVLSAAMSMYCRTRSADEIAAYMQDASASATKRPNNSSVPLLQLTKTDLDDVGGGNSRG
jgi:hypothetical protein